MLKFSGKKHAAAANNRLRLDGKTADARRHLADTVSGERAFEAVIRETTKHTIKQDKAAEISRALDRRKEVTGRLVGAMESGGRQVMFCGDMQTALKEGKPFRPPVSIRMPGDAPGTERVYEVTNTRRVNFFPEIAAQKHAAMVKDLTAFVQRQEPGSICMVTFNAGTRWRDGANIENIREGRAELRGALRKLFKLPAFLEWFEPVSIGEEFGTPKARYSRRTGRWEWHMHTHAHVLLRSRGHIPDFARFMQWFRLKYYENLHAVKFPGLCRLLDFDNPLDPEFSARVKTWLADTKATPLVEYNGTLHHEEEACKYPFKDKDLDALINDGGPAAIIALYDGLFRARLSTPLNSFRAFRREHHQPNGFRKKFITQKTENNGSVLQAVPDWNCQTPNMAEAVAERKRRAKAVSEIKRSLESETLEYKRILVSRLAEWDGFQKNGSQNLKPFPRNDFQLDGFQYEHHIPVSALKREIVSLFGRLISSSILFDVAIPPFVLEQFRLFPEHLANQQAVLSMNGTANRERKPVRNLVVARTAPSFLGGGTIARPGIVVIGATEDGAVWRNNPLARRLEKLARPLIAEAVEQRDYEAALPDFAPPAERERERAERLENQRRRRRAARHARASRGSSQTPLNFQFSASGPPRAGPPHAKTQLQPA